jgi:iron complex transport system substrate-binding protein
MKMGTRVRSLFALIIAMLLMIGTIGCNASDQTSNTNTEQATDKSNDENNAESKTFPVTITDGIGQTITLEKAPERIVSLIPSNTEIIYALGYGDKIIGVTDLDNYPEEVLNKEKVGGMELNLEKIISLNPDLVLANEWHKNGAVDVVAKLQEAGITVLVVKDATSLEEVYETIRLLGQVTGMNGKAEEVVATMKDRYAAIVEKAKEIKDSDKKSVWVEISPPPELYTTGKGTFMHELIEAVGAVNVAGEQEGWPMLTEEQVVASNPDVILLTYNYVDNAVESTLTRSGWEEVTAIKEKQVYLINGDTISRPGPRLMDALEEIAKTVYPDVYK